MQICPLLKYKVSNYDESAFAYKCEKLGLAVLQHDEKAITNYAQQIRETLELLPETITAGTNPAAASSSECGAVA